FCQATPDLLHFGSSVRLDEAYVAMVLKSMPRLGAISSSHGDWLSTRDWPSSMHSFDYEQQLEPPHLTFTTRYLTREKRRHHRRLCCVVRPSDELVDMQSLLEAFCSKYADTELSEIEYFQMHVSSAPLGRRRRRVDSLSPSSSSSSSSSSS